MISTSQHLLSLSALNSFICSRMQAVIHRLSRLLKPGGLILLRDYGRYDLAQLRFKKGMLGLRGKVEHRMQSLPMHLDSHFIKKCFKPSLRSVQERRLFLSFMDKWGTGSKGRCVC